MRAVPFPSRFNDRVDAIVLGNPVQKHTLQNRFLRQKDTEQHEGLLRQDGEKEGAPERRGQRTQRLT